MRGQGRRRRIRKGKGREEGREGGKQTEQSDTETFFRSKIRQGLLGPGKKF